MSSTVPVSIRRGRPLAPMQRALWTSQRRNPTAPLQNMAMLSHIDGHVDVDRLADAFAEVVRASDALGSCVVDEGGTPMMVAADTEVVTHVVDVDRSAAVSWAEERVTVPLDPAVRPYDSVVLRHPDGTVSWYLDIHHLVTDATSTALIFDATAAVYHGGDPGIASYHEWVAAVGDDDSPRRRKASDHWRDRPEAPTAARLYQPVRHPVPDSSRIPVALDQQGVADALAGDYRQVSDELAWSAMLSTATAVLLHKVARIDEMALGLPVHNRSQAERVIGAVMEVFPVDVAVEADDTFRTLHRRVAKSIMTTIRHAAPGLAPTQGYEAVVNVIHSRGLGAFGDLPVRHLSVDSGAIDPGHLVRVQLTAHGDDPVGLALDINHGGADADARARAAEHMATILSAMAAEPDTRLADFDIRTPAEISAQTAWETAEDLGGETLDIVTWLGRTLAERDDTVIEDATQTLSGRELWRRARHVAGILADAEVGPGTRVGIEMGRSVDTVVAIVATLVTGASYVPLDPSQPRARLDALIERAGCVEVLRELPTVPDGEPAVVPVEPAPDQEAYLLFTSGSTGEPKGVPITHLGLAGYIRFAVESYTDAEQPPVVALFSALTFDLTVTSVFTPLVCGGRTVVIGEDGPQALAAIARRSDITWVKATPSHLEILVRLVDADHGIRTLVVGGEAFGSNLARRLTHTLPGVRIFNEYGPTEAVVGCMIHESRPDELSRWAEVPIGRPAPGVTLVVVDEHLRRVPTGSQGELCISHAGLTTGYLGRPSPQTDGPFVQIDGRRFYRSGDLVRMADDETMVYLGRIDEQVKVGGIRLEPIEVEEALERHPAVGRAAVRLWSPESHEPTQHCARCGLPDNVPGAVFDAAGVCHMCHAYDRVAPIAESWFKTADDLTAWLDVARRRRTGDHDCLVLLSGGKDSTYTLYQMAELGFRPYALTLDNGFISEGAKDNVRRSVADLGIDHEFATHEAMNAIFRDSLERHSNVCHGCYKTIYTLATTRAVELGIPLVVTGLSRGQLFETRLIPQQFDDDRFDPDAIDRAVLEARKTYHRIDDGTNRLLDTSVFETDDVFDQVTYLDFYRYVDVELADMLDFLETKAPWVRPSDTGRSTNCLVNAAGIHTHLTEQGYHNYAEPYAWDVRLGHKTRDEAMEELDDQLDLDDVGSMLAEIGYQPHRRETLVAWLEPTDQNTTVPTAAELRAFLTELLPTHAIPAAFVAVDRIPMTTNGKLDTGSLPAPERVHRGGASIHVSAETETQRDVVSVWEQVLGTEPIGVDDDFFAIGGDSLAAMQMIVALSERRGWAVPEEYAFLYTTPRDLSAAIETPIETTEPAAPSSPTARVGGGPPPVSVGEQALLFDQQIHPNDSRYNVGRVHRVHGAIDTARFVDALRAVVARHPSLHWTHGPRRRALPLHEAVDVEIRGETVDATGIDQAMRTAHRRPFDLDAGPLVRCVVQPVADGTTAVMLVFHHVCGDAESFDRIWAQTDILYGGGALEPLALDHADVMAWQAASVTDADRAFWQRGSEPAAALVLHPPTVVGDDGFIERRASFEPAQLHAVPGATAFGVALASLAAVLRRRSDGDRIGLGILASTRNHAAADDLVGYFLNTLPVEITVDTDAALDEIASSAGRVAGAALTHRQVPLAEIVAARRDAGLPAPAVDVLLAHDTLRPATLGNHRVDHHVMFNGTAVAGTATVFVEERADRVDLRMEFAAGAMDRDQAWQLLDDLDAMMAAVIADPRRRVGAVALPSDGSSELAGPPLEAPPTLVPTLLAHASARAGEVAVRCGAAELSWVELDRRSAALAGALQRSAVRHGDRVVICLPRSTDLIAAIVGCHRIGVSYVPVDPGYPPDRIRASIGAAGAGVAIVDAQTVGAIPDALQTVDVGRVDTGACIDVAPSPDDEAYVIFTSGSTGRPRGVPVTHRTLAASTMARVPAYERGPGRFLVVSSPAFDSSIAGLFWALAAGGTVVLPTDAEAHDPDGLLALFASAGVTHTLMVPTLYGALLERGAGNPSWPDQVIVAGEACPVRLVRRHHELRPGSALANEYGPTECTVWATVHHCSVDDDPVPIGPPIPGTWVAVVDEADHPRPEGVQGQLIIGGQGVVPGYLDDDEATLARFGVDDGGRRFFRTGDRAVVRDGTVLFLGRRDHQLNVGGMRAEPEEIEAVLMAEESVAGAIVVAADPRSLDELISSTSPSVLSVAMGQAAGAPDPAAALADALREFSDPDPVLVAHLECVPGSALDEGALRRRAQRELPAGLRPQRYVAHTQLPRSPTGKIDRDAVARLPVPLVAPAVDDHGRTEPDDRVVRVGRLFADVLGIPAGPDESFFDLGGHSLLALALTDRISEVFGVDLGVASLYDHPTPREMARLLEGQATSTASAGQYVVPIQPGGDRPPLFGVHVLGVDAMYYRPLAARLGLDQPVYGLGLATTLEDASAPTAIDVIASLYADELERVAPEGPVILAAVSLGATVAFELASTLRARGREVLMLGLFDAAGPDVRQRRDRHDRLAAHVRELRAGPLRYVRDRKTNVTLRATRRIERAELAARRAVGADLPDRLRVRRFIEANADAAFDHRIAPYDGFVTVFRAEEDPFGWASHDPKLGWGSVAVGDLAVVPVPGGHLSMLAEPHVTDLAAALSTLVDRRLHEGPTMIGRHAVEAQLRHALETGVFAPAVEAFARRDDLEPEAAALVADAEATLRSTADVARRAADVIREVLAEYDIDAEVAPVPALAERAWITVRVADRPLRAVAALEAAGYGPQQPMSPGAWQTAVRTTSRATLVALDDTSTRVTVEWAGNERRSATTPREADLAALDLPAWAWPAYWAVRPVRLATDRIKGRRAGGDLGSYLGTDPSLVPHVLALADVTPDDVLMDIGCGDARVLVEAVQRFGCRARGVERNPVLAEAARARVRAAGLEDRIEIVAGDAADVSMDDVTVAFVFLPAEIAAGLVPGILSGLAPGGRLVAHEQVGVDWPVAPERTELIVTGGLTVAALWRVSD